MSKIRSFLKEIKQDGILRITKDGGKQLYDVDLNAINELDL